MEDQNSSEYNYPQAETEISSEIAPVEPTPPNVFLRKVLFIGIFIVLLIGSVSVGAYLGLNSKRDNNLTLGNAIVNTIEAIQANNIKSGEFSFLLDITGKDIGNNYSDFTDSPMAEQIASQFEDISIKMAYTGAVNEMKGISPQEIEMIGKVNLSITNPSGGSLGMFSAQSLDLDYIISKGNFYVSIQTLPSALSLVIPPEININKYLKQWYFVPLKFNDQYSDFSAMDNYSLKLDKELKGKIIDFIDNSGVIKVVDKKIENINQESKFTAVYIKIDWDKFGQEMKGFLDEYYLNSPPDNLAVIGYDKMDLDLSVSEMKKITSSLKGDSIKVFLGEDGYYHGLGLIGDYVNSKGKVVASYNIIFSSGRFNEKFTINVPSGARNLKEVMSEI